MSISSFANSVWNEPQVIVKILSAVYLAATSKMVVMDTIKQEISGCFIARIAVPRSFSR